MMQRYKALLMAIPQEARKEVLATKLLYQIAVMARRHALKVQGAAMNFIDPFDSHISALPVSLMPLWKA
jgi:hypothetical protein